MFEKTSQRHLKDRNIQVLLIEDDPEDTMLLMNTMAKPGWPSFKFTLLCADDLKSGLALLEEGEVEAVLLDLMLPDSQGIETIIKVRAKAPDVPIVVLTGMQDEDLGLEAVRHGAQDYQSKGNIDAHSLKRTLSYAVERHRMLTGLKNIINGAEDGMIVTDSEGNVYYANSSAETLLNQSPQPLVGKPFPYPLPSNRRGELKIRAADGNERTAELRVSEIEWKDEPVLLVSLRDITDLRRIEQLKAEVRERQRMDKLKDELMSAVSHEMRSPLTIIRAISGDLLEEFKQEKNKDRTHILDLQHRNILRLQKIVDNILDLSRLESGKAILRPERLNILPIIQDSIEGFRRTTKKHALKIENELPDRVPPVYADSDLLVEVLNNLIDNATRFAKSKILIRIQETEDTPSNGNRQKPARKGNSGAVGVLAPRKCIQISVIDDGPGIPKDRIPDLFNKFVQINRSAQGEEYKGTGLGLAICKEIIERQNGKIWAESQEGQGASFHVMLPQYTGEEASQARGAEK